MKCLIKLLSINLTIFFLVLPKSYSLEVYPMIGIWDYKHETDAYALNFKFIEEDEDNGINIKYLGNLKRTYDVSIFADINDGFKDTEISNNRWRSELSLFAGGGLAKIVKLSNNLSFVPSFSLGYYQHFEEGKDMGLPLEFKSELGLNYKIFSSSTVGLAWNHMSNADIGSKNPGSDSIYISLRIKENF